jgi:WD40 repeat protein
VFSPDGKTLATASHDTLVLVREPSGKVLHKLECRKEAIALAYSPDDKMLVSGGGDWDNVNQEDTASGVSGQRCQFIFATEAGRVKLN